MDEPRRDCIMPRIGPVVLAVWGPRVSLPIMDGDDMDSSALALAPTLEALDSAPRPAFDRLREMGFRHVQLSAAQPGLRPRELDRTARRDVAATLRRRELAVSGVDLWIPPGHFADTALADRAVATAIEAIDLAADLGRCPVSVTMPGPPGEGGASIAESAVRSVVDHAQRRGVPLADHAIDPVDREAVGVGIDPAAQLAAGGDPVAAVHRAGGRLVAVRLCDLLMSGLRGPVGDEREGRLDVEAYRVAISINGHAGPVVVDARQWNDPWAGLAATHRRWQRLGPTRPGSR